MCVCYSLFVSSWIAGWHYVMRVSHTFRCLLLFPHGSSYEKIVCTDFKVIFKMYTIKHQFSYFYV